MGSPVARRVSWRVVEAWEGVAVAGFEVRRCVGVDPGPATVGAARDGGEGSTLTAPIVKKIYLVGVQNQIVVII